MSNLFVLFLKFSFKVTLLKSRLDIDSRVSFFKLLTGVKKKITKA